MEDDKDLMTLFVEDLLEQDMILYGSCRYYVDKDGNKIRVKPEEALYDNTSQKESLYV